MFLNVLKFSSVCRTKTKRDRLKLLLLRKPNCRFWENNDRKSNKSLLPVRIKVSPSLFEDQQSGYCLRWWSSGIGIFPHNERRPLEFEVNPMNTNEIQIRYFCEGLQWNLQIGAFQRESRIYLTDVSDEAKCELWGWTKKFKEIWTKAISLEFCFHHILVKLS